MDNQRPQLDLKFYKDICADQNGVLLWTFIAVSNTSLVPIIVVFTKHDQFLRNVEMHMFDYPNEYPNSNLSEVAEKQFQEHYLHPLGDDVRFVRLESEFGVTCWDCMLMSFVRNADRKSVV